MPRVAVTHFNFHIVISRKNRFSPLRFRSLRFSHFLPPEVWLTGAPRPIADFTLDHVCGSHVRAGAEKRAANGEAVQKTHEAQFDQSAAAVSEGGREGGLPEKLPHSRSTSDLFTCVKLCLFVFISNWVSHEFNVSVVFAQTLFCGFDHFYTSG